VLGIPPRGATGSSSRCSARPSSISPGSGSSAGPVPRWWACRPFSRSLRRSRVPLRLRGIGIKDDLRLAMPAAAPRRNAGNERHGRKKTCSQSLLHSLSGKHAIRRWRSHAAAHPRRHGGSPPLGRQRVPALDALEGRADEGDGVVRRYRREALRRHGDQRGLGDHHTHEYEARTLAKAFSEITGIKLKHDLIQEGDVVEKIQTQMQSGRNIYDAWVNDSDLIGTHFRYKQAIMPLTDWMAGEGKESHNPTARHQRLHRHQVLHDRAGRQALPAARPAVREPVLVPLRLVPAPGPQGQVQGQVRLRSRRAGELVGL
jgi:hypothetical protein